MSETIYIYGLIDPRSGECRYVGKTNNPDNRLKQHLRSMCAKTHKGRWVNKLRAEGIDVEMEILAEVPCSTWIFWEQETIRVFRGCGMNLTNASIGGEGPVGYRHTEEAKRAMSAKKIGRPPHPSSRNALKRALEERKALGIRSPLFGKKLSQDTRKRMSDSMKKKVRTESHMKALSLAQTGKKQPDSARRGMREAWKRYFNDPVAMENRKAKLRAGWVRRKLNKMLNEKTNS